MGWLCTLAVSDTLRRLSDASARETQNQSTFFVPGHGLVFWEVDTSKEFGDGHAIGQVWKASSRGDHVVLTGKPYYFRILPDGSLAGPGASILETINGTNKVK